jgi:excisionase family DNA binding protein
MITSAILTTKELARYVKVNEKTLIKLAQNGEIPGVKVGNQWRFHSAVIDNYLKGHTLTKANRGAGPAIDTVISHITLSRLTDYDLIRFDSPAKSRQKVISELARIAYTHKVVSSQDKLIEQLESREKMLSTAIGKGVALPHARHPSPELFSEPKLVILRTANGIQYNSPDNEPVRLFVMICAPNEHIHLRLLARVSKFLYSSTNLDKLLRAQNKKEVMKILLKFDRDFLLNSGSNEV